MYIFFSRRARWPSELMCMILCQYVVLCWLNLSVDFDYHDRYRLQCRFAKFLEDDIHKTVGDCTANREEVYTLVFRRLLYFFSKIFTVRRMKPYIVLKTSATLKKI